MITIEEKIFKKAVLDASINTCILADCIDKPLIQDRLDHSDVVGASPVGAAPTTSSFST